VTATPLERSYRRLLLAYPGSYRRRHGSEILTTLLEMAGPEQHRPDRAERWHLIAGGLRQRFRLPAGKPVAVLGAVLAALILAGFGAAAGSWAGWRTAADLPSDATIAATVQRLGGAAPGRPAHRAGSPWTRVQADTDADNADRTTSAQMAAILAAQGWRRVGGDESTPANGTLMPEVSVPPSDGTPIAADGPVTVRMLYSRIVNVRDGLRLIAVANIIVDPGEKVLDGRVVVSYAAIEPAVVRPLVVAGAVLGGFLGWLLAAAVAQRSRRRRLPVLVAGAALLTLFLPAFALYGNAVRVFATSRAADDMSYAVHAAFTPGRYYPYGPGWQVLALSLAGGVLAAAALPLPYRRRPLEPEPVAIAD
jgi:MFS family permease